MITAYSKVWSIGHPRVREALKDSVLVQEKIDGSQFSFAVVRDGSMGAADNMDLLVTDRLMVRSKGADIEPMAPPAMFREAVEYVKSIQHMLVPGWVYRGEVLAKPKHNTLAYDRVPRHNVILFDIMVGPEDYAPYETVQSEGERLDLEVVSVLFRGLVHDATALRALLDTVSVLGGQKIEGVVLKNYTMFGPDGKPVFLKFVSEAFKEVHSADWRERNPSKGDIVQQLIEKYRTPARWAKAVQHLREASLIEGSPRDIGALIKEAQRDFDEECSEEIAQVLLKQVLPQIRRGVMQGLPEWYKHILLEEQFNVEATNTEAQ